MLSLSEVSAFGNNVFGWGVEDGSWEYLCTPCSKIERILFTAIFEIKSATHFVNIHTTGHKECLQFVRTNRFLTMIT